MNEQDKKERQREASRRWRANHPDKAKQVGRNNYHRRQSKLGLISSERKDKPTLSAVEKKERHRIVAKASRVKNAEKTREINRKHYYKDVERSRKAARDWYHANIEQCRERMRNSAPMRLYGLTPEALEALGKTCHICGTDKNQSRYRMHIDHDHETSKVRGLLCHGCNTGLGGFMDNPGLLMKAIAYLSRDVGSVS